MGPLTLRLLPGPRSLCRRGGGCHGQKSETRRPSQKTCPPASSPRPRDTHQPGCPAAWQAPAGGSLGPRATIPTPGMQRLLRMRASRGVGVFMCVSLFRKQPCVGAAGLCMFECAPTPDCYPPSPCRGPAPPHCPLCLSLQRKGLWETPGLFPLVPRCCLPAACMPPALTKETSHHLGSVVLPQSWASGPAGPCGGWCLPA